MWAMGVTDKLRKSLSGRDDDEDESGIMASVCLYAIMFYFQLVEYSFNKLKIVCVMYV